MSSSSPLPDLKPAFLPVTLTLTGQEVLLIGQDPAAFARLQQLLKAGLAVKLITEVPPDDFAKLSRQQGLTLQIKTPAIEDLQTCALCFISPEQADKYPELVRYSLENRILVHVADRPASSNFSMPSLLNRGFLQIAVSSGGTSPALARNLRQKLETLIPQTYTQLSEKAFLWRQEIKKKFPDFRQRQQFWRKLLASPVTEKILAGKTAEADSLFEEFICRSGASGPLTAQKVIAQKGKISLVGAGAGTASQLTFQAAAALQKADVIFYDALIDESILDLSGPETEKIYVGKRCGKTAVTQAEINRLIAGYAGKGLHVVRLKGGDPLIFGRGGEELTEAFHHQIEIEVIPGITAVSAVAAALKISLTHRELSHSLHLISGHDPQGDLCRFIETVGTLHTQTVGIYMPGRTLNRLAQTLIANGADPELPAAVIANALHPQSFCLFAPLKEIAETLETYKKMHPDFQDPVFVLIGRVLALSPFYPPEKSGIAILS